MALSLAERGRMGNAACSAARIARQNRLNELCDGGVGLKLAAHQVGWSYRSARRWRRRTP